ncbi:MAG: metalloprotease TldD [Candidatus Dactylopiibacterium carminicum]|uniref:Metalloprotease TldD n=1 Tax=Candidatus Dactylopiibacterium carminicum TaxID=857335 RepID=A0A272EXS4_9RHOO|nr:metalloprotease TldD [Candidatus Dactylopiibacterium carminicum]KAF7600513.1 metalloprotease TldD [Candidatus Dactylopiibacterium carminicum]PAS94918.1 MAG: metalloprotease TldD [Candidatus Dactylopiibacterium carminicum]PAT00518.1 MAG: metalloprotease TldD [Candidatus Dactylopiibacterium carminicum]
MNSALTPLQLAQAGLLAPNGLDVQDLSRTLDAVMAHAVDAADLYLQNSRHESWSLEGGIVRSSSFSRDQGFGLRALDQDQSAFAFSQQISHARLLEAAASVRAIARQGGEGRAAIAAHPSLGHPARYDTQDPLASRDAQAKIALLERIDRQARALDSRVSEVNASLNCAHETILVMRQDGRLVADVRPMLRLSVFVIVTRGNQRESASSGIGGRFTFDAVTEETLDATLRQVVDEALIKLDAQPSPSGEMAVVIGPGWPGMLLHEAVGHGFEGDFTRQGSSIYSGRIGQQVAAAGVTIVDNGTLPGHCGSLTVDDEGEASQETVLIENGILRGFMQDGMNARLSGVAPTGNGRRQSYAHLPMPRMTNTYMRAGISDPQEIIASVKSGLYLANLGSGQVDIVSGRFTFQSALAYRIENGRLGAPVKGATLTGHGPEVMQRISMVGNDLALDPGFATCGKAGQNVPVCVGQPTLKVDRLLVGGTA